MIIGVCGFSWSGSSACKELLREYSGVELYNSEFTLAYHPDGLSDLDFHLNENCTKFMSSGVAIPRFRKIANLLLKNETKGKIKKLTNEYLDSLIQAKWIGNEDGQVVLCKYPWLYEKVSARYLRHVVFKLPYKFCTKLKVYPLSKKEFSIKPDGFIEKTQEYTNGIFKAMSLNIDKTIVLDQPFPGNAPSRSMKYYKNAKAIIVDRDPRDIYMFVHSLYSKSSYSVPHNDVKEFISYYKNMHKTLKEELLNPDILYIHFEDLIFEYEKTVKQIEEFTGLSEHSLAKHFFKPEMSIANTRVFLKRTDCQSEIKQIEEGLSEYLYDFSKYPYDGNLEIFNENPITKST